MRQVSVFRPASN